MISRNLDIQAIRAWWMKLERRRESGGMAGSKMLDCLPKTLFTASNR